MKYITICGHSVKVEIIDEETMRLLAKCADDDATPEGLTLIESSTIYLRGGLAPCRLRDTLVHEIAHYLVDASGLKPFLLATVKGDDHAAWEEQVIAHLVPWIVLIEPKEIAL